MHEEEKSVQGIVSQRNFLILSWKETRVAALCVYTRHTYTQVFSGISARIFTHVDVRRSRFRVAVSAICGLCRGLHGWYVSVLLHRIPLL